MDCDLIETNYDVPSKCFGGCWGGDYDPHERIPAKIKSRELVFIHIFSGLRRPGDLQHYLEWSGKAQGFTVIVISLDIAIDRVQGDLMNSDTVNTWRSHIRAGRIAGMGGGPPWETWPAARFLSIKGCDRAPPPLRNRGDPWGKENLSQSNHDRVHCANELLGVALVFM